MTPALLREIGEALHGVDWIAPTARRLDPPVNRKTVERWRDGESPIPPRVWARLAADLRTHRGALSELLRRLPRS